MIHALTILAMIAMGLTLIAFLSFAVYGAIEAAMWASKRRSERARS